MPSGGSIDPELLALLVCPRDHAPLVDERGTLRCTRCGAGYPVVDGIPNLLIPDD